MALKFELQKMRLARYALLFCASIVLLLYAPTLKNGFVMDDIGQVRDNVWIRSLKNIPHAMASCIWESANRGCYGRSFYYRPLHTLSYIATYQISSNAWAFHAVQLMYVTLVGYLLFRVSKLLTKHTTAALLSAFLFLIHPMHHEVAAWISATPEVLMAIFSLLGLYCYVSWRETKNRRFLWAVYGFYALGVLSKEPAVLIPIIYIAFDTLWFKDSLAHLTTWPTVKRYLPFPILFWLYNVLRQSVLGMGLTDKVGELTTVERFHAMTTLFGEYVTKIFWPYPLNVFHLFQKSSDISSPQFLLSLAMSITFVGIIVWFIRKQYRLYALGMIWFVVFIAPVLIYLGGVGTNVLSERYLFVPLLGIAWAAGHYAAKLLEQPKYTKAVTTALATLFIIAAIIIWPRNTIWHDNVSLFTVTLQQSPDAHELRRALAETYFIQGKPEEARKEFEEVLRRAPEWEEITMAYKGLGDYYYQIAKDTELAAYYYERAAATARPTPRDYVTFNNLGMVYMEREEHLKGLASFCQAQALLPEDASSASNFDAALGQVASLEKTVLARSIEEQYRLATPAELYWQSVECNADACQHVFSYIPQNFSVFLPAAITILDSAGNAVDIQDSSYTPITSSATREVAPFAPLQNQPQVATGAAITVTVGAEAKSPLTFYFPTCQQTYYKLSSQ